MAPAGTVREQGNGRETVSDLAILDVTLVDCTGADPRPRTAVLIEDGVIRRIAAMAALTLPRDARVIDGQGRTLLPGLLDAHVHLGLTELTTEAMLRHPGAVYAMQVAHAIEATLDGGFTTVRDAGMLDGGWAHAVRAGHVRGPRILPSGAPISQTGGHGDLRGRFQEHAPADIPGFRTISAIADSPDAVRRAAREQLRRGATQIKVMASGGAMSPADELAHTQLTTEELAAAVAEAHAAGTYVLAHAYHPRAIANALAAGVRSIEHGNFLDEETAARMAAAGAYLVPTLVTYEQIDQGGEAERVPAQMLAKIRQVRRAGDESLRIARAAGVPIASGSDLLGGMQAARGRELTLKAAVLGPMGALIATTRTNAALFSLQDRIGTVEEGKQADLILVDGDPLADIALLEGPARVLLVLKEGRIVKGTVDV
jgi:imidazolonepropionase-like amidohydrolase